MIHTREDSDIPITNFVESGEKPSAEDHVDNEAEEVEVDLEVESDK